MKYFDEIKKSMFLISQHQKTIFIGQAVKFPGTALYNTLENVPLDKRLEMPVFEQTQMGIAIGLALGGYIPINIYPRFNFLLSAMDGLVNHLDKIPYLGYNIGMIIRVAVGSKHPLHPCFQHVGDFSEAFTLMLRKVRLVTIKDATDAVPYYTEALKQAEGGVSTIVVEYGDSYND